MKLDEGFRNKLDMQARMSKYDFSLMMQGLGVHVSQALQARALCPARMCTCESAFCRARVCTCESTTNRMLVLPISVMMRLGFQWQLHLVQASETHTQTESENEMSKRQKQREREHMRAHVCVCARATEREEDAT